jgi:hypothetical protein
MHSLIHVDHARVVAQDRLPRKRHVMRAQHPPSPPPAARRGAARLLVKLAVRLDRDALWRALVR